ncbi:hypothetical protein I79_009511 [Cricetulus griseus]|uniref:Uncharacterized protein n=1 Tax=Cricetulus griseus TaxID=10029 RepID=G3HFZ3_CRIGR|nr:hypothetical protein I79_009511 [Cricetulus griseus]
MNLWTCKTQTCSIAIHLSLWLLTPHGPGSVFPSINAEGSQVPTCCPYCQYSLDLRSLCRSAICRAVSRHTAAFLGRGSPGQPGGQGSGSKCWERRQKQRAGPEEWTGSQALLCSTKGTKVFLSPVTMGPMLLNYEMDARNEE